MLEHEVMGMDFLYRTFKKKVNGVILNEESGMNVIKQVLCFFSKIFDTHVNNPILIVVDDQAIANWTTEIEHCGLNHAQIDDNFDYDILESENLILLLQFSKIKMIETLIDYDYFAVVIDDFDLIGNKMIIRNLKGVFNIGLTSRSFISDPDSKLQWRMLNWANPGCVGKLNEFYQADDDNHKNVRDNYRHFWFRLTWNYSDAFVKPEVKPDIKPDVKNKKPRNKRKRVVQADDVVAEVPKKLKAISEEVEEASELIAPKEEDEEMSINCNEKLPKMDENPILTSIIKNLQTCPDPVQPKASSHELNDPIQLLLNETNALLDDM